MSFKDRLREKRLEANLTQVQLAEKGIGKRKDHSEL